jgi:hypothetical protein
MNARDIEMAALEVERSRHRAVRWLSAGGVLAGIAIALLPCSTRFAVTLGCGAVLEMLLAAVLWLRRRERIEQLALDPSAYAIPAVARFGARVCDLSQRRRLAASIRSMVDDRQPLDLHLVGRTGRFSEQLETLARELAAPAARVEPATAVACRRLVTRPVESPLYNPNLPEEDLRALLLRIRAGITSGGLTA